MVVLASIGYLLGFGFCCIKLTLYYLPIYLIGYLFGQLQDTLTVRKYFPIVKNIVIGFCLGTWLALIARIDFFVGGDGGMFIILRFITSMLGCCAIIGLFTGSSIFWGVQTLRWVGVHSLEIYLSHYLFLNLIQLEYIPALQTLQGTTILIVNYSATLILTVAVIRVIQKNNVMNYLLYGKHAQLNS